MFLSQLGPHTKFQSAVARDPEIARSQVQAFTDDEVREIMNSEGGEDPDITPEGHTLVIEKLNQVIDKLSILTLTMSMSKKKPKFHPAPRPKTELRKQLDKRIAEIEKQDQDEFSRELGF